MIGYHEPLKRRKNSSGIQREQGQEYQESDSEMEPPNTSGCLLRGSSLSQVLPQRQPPPTFPLLPRASIGKFTY